MLEILIIEIPLIFKFKLLNYILPIFQIQVKYYKNI